MSKTDILRMVDITKIYPNGFVANKKVNFSLQEGEIHALVGENGAGKTTLMKILFGLEDQEEGQIFYKDLEVSVKSPLEAIKLGIGMVHQHFMLVESLTVAENIMLGMEKTKKIGLDYKEMIEFTDKIGKAYKLPVPSKKKVKDISIGMKQRVEILKTLAREAKIIILDEPTAVLTPQESEELFEKLKYLKTLGHTIVFISHKLNEVKELCDRITILRQGETIVTANVADLSINDISKLMIGDELPERVKNTQTSELSEVILKINNLTYRNSDNVDKIKDINLDIRAGEIVGIAGIEGNGQKELSDIITGGLVLNENSKGEIHFQTQNLKKKTIRELRELGISHIPEDRIIDGSSYEMSIFDNIISDRYYFKKYNKGPLLRLKDLKKLVDDLIVKYYIKCDDRSDTISLLSGGNIQKVVVAREFSSDTKLIIANQPTRGIDIGSATFIRNQLVNMAKNDNVGVLLISADLEELLSIADTIYVMFDGQIVGKFSDTNRVDEHLLGEYMLGIKNDFKKSIERGINYES